MENNEKEMMGIKEMTLALKISVERLAKEMKENSSTNGV